MKEMLGGCCVCSDERGWAENPLVYCDGNQCTVAVHQACYGIVQVPTGPWFCRKCESQERHAKVRCELCPSKDGALKKTDNAGWAHVVCSLYIPEIRFGNVSTMEPIIINLIPSERFNKNCYICEDRGKESRAKIGACMQCNKPGCKQYFHVTCAQALGLLCEEAGNMNDNVKYCGYCKYHYQKLKKDHNIKIIPAFKPISHSEAQNDSSPEKKSHFQQNFDSSKPPKKKQKFYSTSYDTNLNTGTNLSNQDSDKHSEKNLKEKTKKKKQNTNKETTSTGNSISKSNFSKEFISSDSSSSEDSSSSFSFNNSNEEKNLKDLSSKSESSNNSAKKLKNISKSSFDSDTDNETQLKKNKLFLEKKKQKKAMKVKEKIPEKLKEPKKLKKKKIENSNKKEDIKMTSSESKVPNPEKKVPNSEKKVINPEKKLLNVENKTTNDKLSNEFITKKKNQVLSSSVDDDKKLNENKVLSTKEVTKDLNSCTKIIEDEKIVEVKKKSEKVIEDKPKKDFNLPEIFKPDIKLAEDKKQINPPQTLEELLERQWIQGAQFLMEQSQNFDISSLISCLYQLKSENKYLDDKLKSLVKKRDHLIAVNSRLAIPLNGVDNWDVSNNNSSSNVVNSNNISNTTSISTSTTTNNDINLFYNQNQSNLNKHNFASIHSKSTTPSPTTFHNKTQNNNHQNYFNMNCVNNNINSSLNNQNFNLPTNKSLDLNSNLNNSFFDLNTQNNSVNMKSNNNYHYNNSLFQAVNGPFNLNNKTTSSPSKLNFNNNLNGNQNNNLLASQTLFQNFLQNQQNHSFPLNQQQLQQSQAQSSIRNGNQTKR